MAVLPASAADFNLRDFGGYRARSGARLRTGLLFRSGQLEGAGSEFGSLLARIGVDHVLDLRGASERTAIQGLAFDGYSGAVLTATINDDTIPHALSALMGAKDVGEVPGHMVKVYRTLPASPRFRQSLCLWFAALDAGSGASLIHCFAGKDRTGVAVALLQLVLGVHRDDVFHDYLLTNQMGAERVASGMSALRQTAPPGMDDDILREVMAVQPAYLAAALEVIGEGPQAAVEFIRAVTGLSEAGLQRIERRLLE